MLRNRLLLAMEGVRSGGVLPHAREVVLARGEVLFEEGGRVPSVIFPEGALLSSVATMADGRTVEVASLGQDGAAGLLSCLTGEKESVRTLVRIGGRARTVPAAVLKTLAEDDPGARAVLMKAARKATVRAEQELACRALHDVTARLAKWLLLARMRTGDDRLPLTQDEMALVMGVQRTTVNASAMQLKAVGGVHYSRGVLQVLCPDRLEALACECYARVSQDLKLDLGSLRPSPERPQRR